MIGKNVKLGMNVIHPYKSCIANRMGDMQIQVCIKVKSLHHPWIYSINLQKLNYQHPSAFQNKEAFGSSGALTRFQEAAQFKIFSSRWQKSNFPSQTPKEQTYYYIPAKTPYYEYPQSLFCASGFSVVKHFKRVEDNFK